MEAIIYAAGVGGRLQQKSAGPPKILLEFGGRSLLEWHIVRLVESGVNDCVVVSGYREELIRAAIEDLTRRYAIRVRQLVNPVYTEGSVLSLHNSLPVFEGKTEPVLLMDGDVLYPAAMLRRLIESRHPTVLLIDREYSTADDDPVLVPIAKGRPFEFLKKWHGEAELVGESIGFFKVDPRDLPALIAETERRTTGEERKSSYDEVIRTLVRAGQFGYEDVTGMPWTEIDFPEDVLRARDQVLPAIESFEGEKKGSRISPAPR